MAPRSRLGRKSSTHGKCSDLQPLTLHMGGRALVAAALPTSFNSALEHRHNAPSNLPSKFDFLVE